MTSAKIVAGFLLTLWVGSAQAVLTGSDSLVSVEPFTIYPATDTDNQILQFAFMQNGFALGNNTTTCTFGSVFPVAGTVSLAGGALYLGTDLVFQNPGYLVSAGYIWGNGHQLDLSSSMTSLAATYPSTFHNASIFLDSDLAITGSTKFLGTCIFDGGGHTISINSGANIVIGHGAQVTLRNMTLKGVSNANVIQCLDNSANLILDNASINMSGNYTFTGGSILFKNDVRVEGPYVFTFGPSVPSTIASNSTLMFDVNTTLSYDPSVANGSLLLLTDPTSFLLLNNCSVFSTRTGLSLSQGTMVVDNLVTFSSQARIRSEGIMLNSSLNTILFSDAQLDVFGVLNVS